jgi:hypothetical protein
MSHGFWSLVFGRLDVESLDFLKAFFHPGLNDIILSGAAWVVIFGAAVTAALLTWFRGPMWDQTTDRRRSKADRCDVYRARADLAGLGCA